MKACFQIAECSLSYAKIMQMSAMKACFQIAECSLSYAKIKKKFGKQMKCVLKYLKENSQLDSLLPPTEGK